MPGLVWKDVILELDYPGFIVPDVEGLNFIYKAYTSATTEPFPVTAIFRSVLVVSRKYWYLIG